MSANTRRTAALSPPSVYSTACTSGSLGGRGSVCYWLSPPSCKCGAARLTQGTRRVLPPCGRGAEPRLERRVDVARGHLKRDLPLTVPTSGDTNARNLAGRADVHERGDPLGLAARVDHEHPRPIVGPLFPKRIAAAPRRGVERERNRLPGTCDDSLGRTGHARRDLVAVVKGMDDEERPARRGVVRIGRRLDRYPGRPERGTSSRERGDGNRDRGRAK